MIRTTSASLTRRAAILLACLACAAMLSAAPALAASEPTITYQPITLAEFKQDLTAGKIKAVVINKRLRSLRVTLKDGSHVLAKYGPKEEKATAAEITAKGVAVTVLKPTEAAKEVPKHKHKLRYIAGGILIVVVIIVGGVLVIDRKRKAQRD